MGSPVAPVKGSEENCDIVTFICDIFDGYLINEEHGTEYLIAESNNFHRQLVQLFEEADMV
jgi:hypothetical protein